MAKLIRRKERGVDYSPKAKALATSVIRDALDFDSAWTSIELLDAGVSGELFEEVLNILAASNFLPSTYFTEQQKEVVDRYRAKLKYEIKMSADNTLAKAKLELLDSDHKAVLGMPYDKLSERKYQHSDGIDQLLLRKFEDEKDPNLFAFMGKTRDTMVQVGQRVIAIDLTVQEVGLDN